MPNRNRQKNDAGDRIGFHDFMERVGLSEMKKGNGKENHTKCNDSYIIIPVVFILDEKTCFV